MDAFDAIRLDRSEGRDMEPLRERPGYNASPNDWVRYANYVEAERDEWMRRAKDRLSQLCAVQHALDLYEEEHSDVQWFVDGVRASLWGQSERS